MLGAGEPEQQFCSERDQCEKQGDSEACDEERRGSADPATWEKASGNSFPHQAVSARCLPDARFCVQVSWNEQGLQGVSAGNLGR